MTDASTFSLTDEERRALCAAARWGIECGLAGIRPEHENMPVPPAGALHRELGSFVTLKRGGRLRGCIGTIVPHEALYRNVARMAYAAAFSDSRFPPLKQDEWKDTEMELSVLGPMELCPDPALIDVGRHGLVLHLEGRTGVFLPKVPLEQGWDRAAYLENLCRKAGLPAGSWKHPQARLFWYEALVFAAGAGE